MVAEPVDHQRKLPIAVARMNRFGSKSGSFGNTPTSIGRAASIEVDRRYDLADSPIGAVRRGVVEVAGWKGPSKEIA